MSLSATIALNHSSTPANTPVLATLTISNSAASPINMYSIKPYAFFTGDTKIDEASVALGAVPLSAGFIIAIPGSGSQTFQFQVTPLKGSKGSTYSINCYCQAQDGSQFTASSDALLTAYGDYQRGYASLAYSTVTVGSATVVHGGNLTTVTMTLKDASNTQLSYDNGNVVQLYIVPGSGTSTGSITTPVYDVMNGTLTAQFVSGAAGTALTIAGTINGFVVKTVLPTITVT